MFLLVFTDQLMAGTLSKQIKHLTQVEAEIEKMKKQTKKKITEYNRTSGFRGGFSQSLFSQSGDAQYFWSDKHLTSFKQHAARQE